MTIPDYQKFMRPLLMYAVDGQEKSIKQSINFIGDQLGLSEDDRDLRLPSGTKTYVSV